MPSACSELSMECCPSRSRQRFPGSDVERHDATIGRDLTDEPKSPMAAVGMGSVTIAVTASEPFVPLDGNDVWRPEPTRLNPGAGIDAVTIFLWRDHMTQEGCVFPHAGDFQASTSVVVPLSHYY